MAGLKASIFMQRPITPAAKGLQFDVVTVSDRGSHHYSGVWTHGSSTDVHPGDVLHGLFQNWLPALADTMD
jgi:hypothetical protein